MSWKDIIKQNKFDFNNLKFEYNKIGENLRAVHDFGEGVEFSIIAGGGAYSQPRDVMLKDPMAYTKYEVMLIHPEVNYPQEIGIEENNMVFAYKTKEEITEYARKVEANLPSKLKEKKQKKNLSRLVDAFREQEKLQ